MCCKFPVSWAVPGGQAGWLLNKFSVFVSLISTDCGGRGGGVLGFLLSNGDTAEISTESCQSWQHSENWRENSLDYAACVAVISQEELTEAWRAEQSCTELWPPQGSQQKLRASSSSITSSLTDSEVVGAGRTTPTTSHTRKIRNCGCLVTDWSAEIWLWVPSAQ